MLTAAIAILVKPGAAARAGDPAAVQSSIEVAPRAILFEPEEVGNQIDESRPVAVTFTSSAIAGGAPVKFSGPVISRGFAIVANGCREPLMPAASCSITVAFAPIAEGGQRGTLQLISNAANSPHIVKLRGKGVAGPLTFQKKLHFGALKVDGTPASMSLKVTNNTRTAIKFSSVAASPPFNVTANTCETLEAGGGSCVVRVEFAPRSAGIFKGTLELRDTAAKSPQHVKLVGVAN
ncbi:MAG: choice-of-anchor D domain-containing protein [Candidatus Binatus sp.]|uniref:choice-of-anchor D domain-containing protein n=1 Tax=Candidatus Binatus sp. TaxID=2811406 RepID=UPI00271FABBC|nr:choice-of-anchor D domain-containing protein [Candidatus Binatus sp.]MDO8431650.1 choice-of-anchor D domain-containing protein [Candidatus Binatus sp.]